MAEESGSVGSERVGKITDLITRLAVGEFEARADTTPAGDEVDAILAGLNMLAEELAASEAKRRGSLDELRIANEALAAESIERERAEQETRSANGELRARVGELELVNGDITRLTEMGSFLLACDSLEEALAVISDGGRRLFHGRSGVLFLYRSSRNILEVATTWGKEPLDRSFAPNDCWALRRGGLHLGERDRPGLACAHARGASPPTLCVQMAGRGETLGVLHLSGGSPDEEIGSDPGSFTEVEMRLAVAVAAHASLTLANLQLKESLRTQSLRDPLTGMYNRRYMQEALAREMARAERTGSDLSLAMVDFDHFKRYNDDYGHDAGDLLLERATALIQRRIRRDDIACRFGGEEFLLIFPEATAETAIERLDAIRAELAQLPIEHGGRILPTVTISAGVAGYPKDGLDADLLVKAADTALYAAKAAGRDRCLRARSPVPDPEGAGSPVPHGAAGPTTNRVRHPVR